MFLRRNTEEYLLTINAPNPSCGLLPRKEAHYMDMIKPAPYLPYRELNEDAFDRLVSLSEDAGAPVAEIIARPYLDHYEVLYGYDYLKAYNQAHPFKKINLSLFHYSNSEAINVSFDLNSKHYDLTILDIAYFYKRALDHFNWKNIELARALNLKPSTICNRLKLINLIPEVKQFVADGKLSIEQAKALSRLSKRDQLLFAKKTIKNGWDSRRLYKEINPKWKPKFSDNSSTQSSQRNNDYIRLEDEISENLGTPAQLTFDQSKNYSGTLDLSFFSLSELEGVLKKIKESTKDSTRWNGSISFSIKGLNHFEDILGDIRPDDDF